MKYLNPLKGLIGLLIFCTSPCVFALVAPYYQSIREIEKILSSSEVANKLSAYPIQSIVRNDAADEVFYNITVKDCTLKVKIIYKEPKKGFVGPAEFEVLPENTCNKN